MVGPGTELGKKKQKWEYSIHTQNQSDLVAVKDIVIFHDSKSQTASSQ